MSGNGLEAAAGPDEGKPLEADVRFEGRATLRCRVVDLSQRGARLSCAGLAPDPRPGLGLTVGLRLPSGARGAYFRIQGAVSRAGAGGVDVRFDSTDAEAQAAIRLYLEARERGRLAEGQRRRLAHLSARIGEGARARLVSGLDELVAEVLTHLGESLGQSAGLADSDAQRVLLTDDAALLERAGRDRALRRVLVAEMVRPPHDGQGRASAMGAAQLLDDEQTAARLARDALADRLEQELGGPLAAIRARMGERADSRAAFPLSPARLARVLERALCRLGLSTQSRVFALGVAEHPLIANLNVLYRDLLGALDESGTRADGATGRPSA